MARLVFFVLFLALCTGHSSASYCLCKDGVGDDELQKALDYACGYGADCGPIQPSGPCYKPNTVKDHCNYAVNSYYQNMQSAGGTCDFAGAATTSPTPPSKTSSGCVYPSSPSDSGTGTTPPPSGTPKPPPSSGTPPKPPPSGTPKPPPSSGTPPKPPPPSSGTPKPPSSTIPGTSPSTPKSPPSTSTTTPATPPFFPKPPSTGTIPGTIPGSPNVFGTTPPPDSTNGSSNIKGTNTKLLLLLVLAISWLALRA